MTNAIPTLQQQSMAIAADNQHFSSSALMSPAEVIRKADQAIQSILKGRSTYGDGMFRNALHHLDTMHPQSTDARAMLNLLEIIGYETGLIKREEESSRAA